MTLPFVFVLSAYLNAMKGKCDPFQKMKVSKVQNSLQSWAKDNKFVLDELSAAMKARNKKVVTKTFHDAGLVVPWNKKTELGYRELIETDGEFWKSDRIKFVSIFMQYVVCNSKGSTLDGTSSKQAVALFWRIYWQMKWSFIQYTHWIRQKQSFEGRNARS